MYKQHLRQIWTLCQHSADAELFFSPKLLRNTLNNEHFINHSPFITYMPSFPDSCPRKPGTLNCIRGKQDSITGQHYTLRQKALFNDQTGELLLTTWSTNRAGRAMRINDNTLMLYPFSKLYSHFHHWHYFNVLLLDICIGWLSNWKRGSQRRRPLCV